MREAQTPFERPDGLAERGITDPRNPEVLAEQQALIDDPAARQAFEAQIDAAGRRRHRRRSGALVREPGAGADPPVVRRGSAGRQGPAADAGGRAAGGGTGRGPGRPRRRRGPEPAAGSRTSARWCAASRAGLPAVYVPGAYNNNYQIVQSPGYVTILYEWMHETRIIPLDDRPHLPAHVRQWIGGSARPVGGRHPGRRDDQLLEQDRVSGRLLQPGGARARRRRRRAALRGRREPAPDRALHAGGPEHHRLERDRRESRQLGAALDLRDAPDPGRRAALGSSSTPATRATTASPTSSAAPGPASGRRRKPAGSRSRSTAQTPGRHRGESARPARRRCGRRRPEWFPPDRG